MQQKKYALKKASSLENLLRYLCTFHILARPLEIYNQPRVVWWEGKGMTKPWSDHLLIFLDVQQNSDQAR